jgi:RimJ/RimL family protein N-acetyltransferase
LIRGPIEFPVAGLGDGVIRIRLLAESDVPAITDACQDPGIQRFTTVPSPYEPRHAHAYVARSHAGAREGTALAGVVVAPDDGRLLGSAGIHEIDRERTGRAQIGYWVVPAERGAGVATRAVRLLSAWAFEALGLARLEITVEPINAASVAVAERAGFTREGLLRSYMPAGGMRRDMLMYSLLPDDLR